MMYVRLKENQALHTVVNILHLRYYGNVYVLENGKQIIADDVEEAYID
jgi:hypothetical protein